VGRWTVTVAPIPSSLCEYATACLLSFRLLPVGKLDPVRPGDDKVEESLHRGHKMLSSRRALATMSVIASTGAMLFIRAQEAPVGSRP